VFAESPPDKTDETRAGEVLEDGCASGHVFSRFNDGFEHTKLPQIDEHHGTGFNSGTNLGEGCAFFRSPGGGVVSFYIDRFIFDVLVDSTDHRRHQSSWCRCSSHCVS
jgi:hypothetical protein